MINYKHILTVLATLLLVVSFQPLPAFGQETATAPTEAASEATVAASEMTPQSIMIPALDLFTTVESVGQTENGAMDVPSDWENVAWYEPGYAPGENGRAALAAHLDWEGSAGPFWDLQSVPTGSLIAVVGTDNRILVYRTVSNTSYGRSADVSAQVFGPADTSRLSLITCEGNFLQEEDTYEERHVVDAVLIFDSANPDSFYSTL